MTPLAFWIRLALLSALWSLGGCVALPDPFVGVPLGFEDAGGGGGALERWSEGLGGQSDVQDCAPYHTSDPRWGEVIGCQRIETLDARDPRVAALVDAQLRAQACRGFCRDEVGVDGAVRRDCSDVTVRRPMVRTRRHLLFLDKESDTLWYVPADYYSDGLSIPDWLTPMLVGSTFDTASPKSLPAAFAHDRYVCLREYSKRWAPDGTGGEEATRGKGGRIPYRRRGCANDAFTNALRTSGTANAATTLMQTAVGLANRERRGYCPTRQSRYVDRLERQMSGDNPAALDVAAALRPVMADCFPAEPLVLCLSDPNNLRDVIVARTRLVETAGIPVDWVDLATLMFCLEHQATRRSRLGARLGQGVGRRAGEVRVAADDALCEGFPHPADADFTSPLRAGDLWIEAAARLECQRPVKLLALIGDAPDIDQALARLVRWNQTHLYDQMDEKARAAFEADHGAPAHWEPCLGLSP